MPAGKASKTQRKFLENGALNPDYKPRASRAKTLPDGSPNPKFQDKKKKSSGPSGKRLTGFDHGFFVAWDGEGENLQPEKHPLYQSWQDDKAALLAYIVELGRGHVTSDIVNGVRERAIDLLKRDLETGEIIGFDSRLPLYDLTDSDDEQVMKAIDKIRDTRLKGRLAYQQQAKKNRGAKEQEFTTITQDENIARLKENRRRGAKELTALPPTPDTSDPRPDPTVYPHAYTLLAAGWYDLKGEWREESIQAAPGERLTTKECLGLVWKVVKQVPKYAIHVGFSLGYDMTHILYSLEPAQLENALAPTNKIWGWIDERNMCKVLPRKTLEFKNKKSGLYWRLWDVFGFFQSAFVPAIESWLGSDYPDLDLIKRGKAARGSLEGWGDVDPMVYNRAELQALVKMMGRVRDAFNHAGLKLARWDGAGAAAVAAYKAYMTNEWFETARQMQRENHELDRACKYAYFGGRIENLFFGSYSGPLWHADINSAYPSGMVTVPDLARGEWQYIKRPDPMTLPLMSVYHVAWDFENQFLTPFPLRLPDGKITFAPRGEGWYWGPEVVTVLKALQGDSLSQYGTGWNWNPVSLAIEECYTFMPEDPAARPFSWVADLYRERQDLVRQGEQGKQKAIKLALNSLYGKTAQHTGYQPSTYVWTNKITGRGHVIDSEGERVPPYYNLAMAGYITSYCRAQLLQAALTNPPDVIAFATDGIFTRGVIDVPVSDTKELGKWELKQYDHAEFIIVQPGIYYQFAGGKWKEASRGFPFAKGADRQIAILSRVTDIKDAWHRYYTVTQPCYDEAIIDWLKGGRKTPRPVLEFPYIRIDAQRLVGLKASLVSQTSWDRRGCWVPVLEEGEIGRKLRIYAASDKRELVEGERNKNPALELLLTAPVYHRHGGMSLTTELPLSCEYEGIPYLQRLEFEDLEGDMFSYYEE